MIAKGVCLIQVVVGISTDAGGMQLALLLLRPLSILASLCLFRFGFVVGTLEVSPVLGAQPPSWPAT